MHNLKIVQYLDGEIDYSFDSIKIKKEVLKTGVVSMTSENMFAFICLTDENRKDIVETLLLDNEVDNGCQETYRKE